jgi:hypothetical protein
MSKLSKEEVINYLAEAWYYKCPLFFPSVLLLGQSEKLRQWMQPFVMYFPDPDWDDLLKVFLAFDLEVDEHLFLVGFDGSNPLPEISSDPVIARLITLWSKRLLVLFEGENNG